MVNGAQETLQAIIDANDQPVFALDRDFRYTAFNRAHYRTMKALYGVAIALGGRLPDYQTVAADRESALANLEKALGGECVVARASSGEEGRQRSFEVVHTPQTDAAGAIVGVVVRAYDVTERQHTEDALRRSHSELLALVDSVPEVVFQVDRDYRLVVANERFAQTTLSAQGRPMLPGELVLAPEYPEEVNKVWRGYYDRAFAGESFMAETSFPFADGTHFMENYLSPVREDHGDVSGVVVTSRDVTESKRAQQATRDSEARFRGYFEQSLDGVAVTSPDKGWIEANQATCDLLGYSREELQHLTWADMTHPDDLAADVAQFERLLAGAIDGYRLEKRFVRKDGSVVDVDLGVRCQRGPDGKVDYVLALLSDISERKRAEGVRAFLARTSSGTTTTGEPFFEALARYLAESLEMDFVCIDRLDGDGLTAHTIAVWCDGQFEDNVSYALKDTPCGDVVGKTVCCFPASVCQYFPRDQVLLDLRAESYVGVTLFDHTGSPRGLIAVIGRRPLTNRGSAEAVLELVAVRAAAELEALDAESELREMHRRLDLAQRASGAGIWDWDVTSGAIEWSPEMFVLFGLDVKTAEAGFDVWNGALHPDDLEVSNARIATALADHSLLDSEYRIVKPDGEVRWISALGQGVYNEQGEAVRMNGMCMDITARKTAEADLREARDYLENLFGYANAPVIVWDPELLITRFNHAFEDLTQLSADEVIGQHLGLLFPEDERRQEALAHVTSATAGERWQIVEIPILRADGEVRTVLWNSATIYEADGLTPTATIAQGQDITERKLAEVEIQRLNADLERRVDERTRDLTAANAELEDFVHSIAHDLRSPLRALSGFSDLVQADYGDIIDDTGRDYLRRIHDAAHHLGDLMDALLSLSKISRRELELRDVDLSALARSAAKQLRDAEPERAVEFDIEGGLVARGDPALCEIIVQNLLGNAWKFSVGASPARISFDAECDGGQRMYVVRDNGVGFDSAYGHKLFLPFERLHTAEEFPGTGIGLATVRRAVTRLGGSCWAKGELGRGAEVWFTLGERC
jgi:PAS domain S-box-containing protein